MNIQGNGILTWRQSTQDDLENAILNFLTSQTDSVSLWLVFRSQKNFRLLMHSYIFCPDLSMKILKFLKTVHTIFNISALAGILL